MESIKKSGITIIQSHIYSVSREDIRLISEISAKEDYLGFRTEKSLFEASEKGNIYFAVSGKTIIGWIEKYHLWNNWWGLSTLYIHPAFREQGIGRKKLLPFVVSSLRKHNVYAATANPLVWPVLETLGFQEKKVWRIHPAILINIVRHKYDSVPAFKKLARLVRKSMKYYIKKL